MDIRVHYQNVKFQLKGSKEIKKWLTSSAGCEGYNIEKIDYFFIDNESQRRINEEFLEHHYYTDVITFDYTEGNNLSGEIYIAIDTVRSNTHIYKTRFREEYLRVMLHGLLHLIGYKDRSDAEKTVMRSKEDFYLRKKKDGKY